MPQASDELRGIMAKRFGGSGIDDGAPYNFLIQRGWKEASGFLRNPHTDLDAIPMDEWECVCFLIEEWDYALEKVAP